MAKHYVRYNDQSGRYETGPTPGAPVSEDFDVGAGGQSQFVVAVIFSANTLLEVLVNGREQREGASHDFVRDVANNRINFSSPVSENGWVRVKVY